MSLSDSLYYVTLGNPISKAFFTTASNVLNYTGITAKDGAAKNIPVAAPIVRAPLWQQAGNTTIFIRLAGFSGAIALLMSAYGKNMLGTYESNKDFSEAKTILEYASRAHLLSSILLVAVPLTHRPYLSGSLLVCGTTLYCSVNYYRAFTGDGRFRQFAIMGGLCLTMAWFSLMF